MLNRFGVFPETSRYAIASFVLALGGLACFVFGLLLIEANSFRGGFGLQALIGSIGAAGLACGLRAVVIQQESEGRVGGRLLSVLGLSLSGACLVGFLVSTQFSRISEWKDRQERATCSGNLELLREALQLHAEKHNGRLPSAHEWSGAVLAVISELKHNSQSRGSIMQCPANSSSACTYGFNASLAGKKLAELPPGTILIYETKGGWNNAGDPRAQASCRHLDRRPNAIRVNGIVGPITK